MKDCNLQNKDMTGSIVHEFETPRALPDVDRGHKGLIKLVSKMILAGFEPASTRSRGKSPENDISSGRFTSSESK